MRISNSQSIQRLFLTNKGSYVQKDTILLENDKLINDQHEVCNIFNSFFFFFFFFFLNVAKNIGENSIPINNEHPSIVNIQENLTVQSKLNLKPVDEEFVSKQIGRLNVKKATGHIGFRQKF